MVALLVVDEHYHRACLNGRVQHFLDAGATAGYTILDEFNQGRVDEPAQKAPQRGPPTSWPRSGPQSTPDPALTARARRLGVGGDSDVGPYPRHRQAFRVATGLLTHADDIALSVTPDDAGDRLALRTAFSRFALTEKDGSAAAGASVDGTRVLAGGTEVVVPDSTSVTTNGGPRRDLDDLEIATSGWELV